MWTKKLEVTMNHPLTRLSTDLLLQGYSAPVISHLMDTVPQFRKRFHAFVANADRIQTSLSKTPDAYHLWEDLEHEVQTLLEYTNRHRGSWLFGDLPLAATA